MARNEKMNISYTIKAVDKFTATHQKLTKQLDSLERKFDKLESNKTINVNANTKVAENQLERIDRKVDKIPKFAIITIVTKGYKDFRRTMDRVADFSRDMGEIMQGFASGSALTLLPPAVIALAGGLGAVASAATPAALGFAGLAAVAIPTITKIVDKYDELTEAREELALAKTEEEIAKATEKLEEVTASMTKGQLHAAEALDRFNGFYREFSQQFEPKILDIFTNSLSLAGNLLTTLEPAIHGAATAVNNLINAFNQSLEAEDMKAFFAWVGDTAGPNIEKLMTAVGNFLAGFANMMVAFDPLSQGFMDGFLEMSESFRDWSSSLAENKGFQDFVAMVQANAPAILSFLGNFTRFVWQVIEAMMPFSMWIMNVTNKIVTFMANLMETNPMVANLIGFIMTAVTAFMALGAPLLLAASIMRTALGPAFGFIVKHAGTVVNIFKGPVIRAIAQVASKLLWFAGGPVGVVIRIIALLATIIIANWDSISAWTVKTWNKISNAVQKGASAAWDWVKSTFSKIVDWVSSTMDKAESAVSKAWSAIKTAVTVAGAIILSTVKGKFQSIVSSVQSKMSNAKSAVSNAWNSIKSNTASAISSAVSTVSSKFSSMVSTARSKMTSVRSAISNAWNSIKSYLRGINLSSIGANIIQGLINGVKSKARGLIDAAKGAVSSAVKAAENLLGIHSPSRVFFEIGEYVDEGFINGMLSMVRKVRSAGEKMANAAMPRDGVEIPLYTSVDPSSTPSAIRNSMLRQESANGVDPITGEPTNRDIYIVMDKKVVGRLIADDVKAEIDSKGSRKLAIKGAIR